MAELLAADLITELVSASEAASVNFQPSGRSYLMPKASFSYVVACDRSTDELEEALVATELVVSELSELAAALSLAELADELALEADELPPHAASTNDKDSDAANVVIFPTVFIMSLPAGMPSWIAQKTDVLHISM